MMTNSDAQRLRTLEKDNKELKQMVADLLLEKRVLKIALEKNSKPAVHAGAPNGPEFIARTVRDGLANRDIRPLYIDTDSPWQNGYVESFNSRFRDECLNSEQLYTVGSPRRHL